MRNFTLIHFIGRHLSVMCKFYVTVAFFLVGFSALSQPAVLYTGLSSTTPSATNSRFTMNTVGGFRQYRFQSNQAAAAGTIGWAFHVGTPGAPNYSPCWRANSAGQTLSVNTFTPVGFNNGANYFATGGGNDGLLPAITSGNYYTFNVASNSAASNNMQLLETVFSPVTFSNVTQYPAVPTSTSGVTINLTASATPNAAEYVYVRYSIDNFVTSSIVLVNFTGTIGRATIPAIASGTVRYYIFSSNKTAATLATDVTGYAQAAYDMATLNLINNGGSNYSYTVGGAFSQYERAGFSSTYTAISTGSGATAIVGGTAIGNFSGTTGTSSLDDGSALIPLPFTFNYAGTNYTTSNYVEVGTNGVVGFNNVGTNASKALTGATNTNAHTTTGPNSQIAVWWDDLAQSATSVLYQTQGVAPNRTFTVQYTGCTSYWSTATTTINFQVVLYESSNVIELKYGTVSKATHNTSESASIGLEWGTGGPGNFIDGITGSKILANSGYHSENFPVTHIRFYPVSSTPSPLAAGTYNVGASQTYEHLTDAIADLNQRGVAGAITFNCTNATYNLSQGNIFPLVTGQITGVSSTNTITFNGNGASISSYGYYSPVFTLSGNTLISSANTNVPVLGLIGSDYITVQNFSISQASTLPTGSTKPARGIYVINATATDGATNNTFRDLVVSLDRTNTSSIAIQQNTLTTPTSAAGANSNNKYLNLAVSNTYAGIYLLGTTAFPDLNSEIGNTVPTSFNLIGNSATANDIGNGATTTYGIRATAQSAASIYNNEVSNVTVTGGVAAYGVWLENSLGISNIYRNKVHDIKTTSTSTSAIMHGIRADVNTGATANVYNNFVYSFAHGISTASATQVVRGIATNFGSGTGTVNVNHNTVSINLSTAAASSSALSTSSGTVNARNNIFINLSTGGATSKRYAVYFPSGSTLISNYNDLFVAPNTNNFVGYNGTTDQATLANWQASTGTPDPQSINTNPTFVSATDLHLNYGATPNLFESAGASTAVTNVTTDIDNQTRPGPTVVNGGGTAPDIGADEIDGAPLLGSLTLGTNSIASATISQGTTNNAIYSFSVAAAGSNTALTALNITLTGTYAATDVSNLKAWYQSSATFNAGTATLLSTITAPGVAGVKTFTPFTSQTFIAGATGYIFITTDISCAAIVNNIIAVNAVTSANTTFSSGTVSGTPAAGNNQTLGAALPLNVTGPAASIANVSSAISWTNPTGCYDEIMIVAATAANSGVPTGNGAAYTVALAFGSGTALGNGFVVYKGTTSPQTVTGLTNGTTYFYKIFTRFGTTWSSGIEVSATPNITYCLPSGQTTDGISGVVFNTISNTGTGINGYTDYTATQSTSISIGSAYNLNVYVNTGGNYTNNQKVWIDWNQDGLFNTTAGSAGGLGEEYTLGTATNVTNGLSSLCPFSITVPAGATLGNTRMRVSSKYNGYTTSCATGVDGEFEDYRLIIIAATVPGCANYTSPAAAATNICSPGSLNWTAPSSGGSPTGYKLYFGTDGGGVTDPTNISNGNNIGNVLTYTFSGLTAATTYYWKIVPTNATGDATGCTIQSFTTSTSVAETTTPVADNFEDCPEWIFVNATTNKWIIGNATGNTGKAIYVSNDNGVTNAYSNLSSASHFYRDVTFPAGQTIYDFNFDLKGNYETTNDRLLVYIAPTSVTPVAGTPAAGSTTLSGATLVFTQSSSYAAWTNVSVPLTTTQVGNATANSTVRFIFVWQNNASINNAPPAAIDNITITSSIPQPVTIGTITATQQTGNVYQNSTNNNILRIEIPATGTLGSQTLNSVRVTAANINDADIAVSGVSLWTGTAAAPVTQIGTSQSFAAGIATFSGLTTAITAGTTYLWVRYNLPVTATPGNTVDARIAIGDIVITEAGGATASGTQPASLLDPVGNRTIIAAMCGGYTINNTLPTAGTNYNSFTDAITDLNLRGISCAVIFNVKDGLTYNELPPAITTTGTLANTITFQRDNSTATKPMLSGTNGTGTTDAIIRLNGVDYLTWDGINLSENTITNTTNTLRMEYGVFLNAANATNGCQNNVFRNFSISLTANNGNISKAINTLSVATSTSGTNSNNKFYNLQLSNATWGYSFDASSPTVYDNGNEIDTQSGGTSSITNISATSMTSGYGVQISYQTGLNIRNTTLSVITGSTAIGIYGAAGSNNIVNIENCSMSAISNASGTSVIRAVRITAGSATTITGCNITGMSTGGSDLTVIYVSSGTLTATNNIIGSAAAPVTSNYTGGYLVAIEHTAGASVAATITGNTISNLIGTGTSSFVWTGINSIGAGSIITGNTIQNSSTMGASASWPQYAIYSEGANARVSNNIVNNISCNNGADLYGIYVYGDNSAANSNTVSNITGTSSGYIFGVVVEAAATKAELNNISNISTGSGIAYGVYLAWTSDTLSLNTITGISSSTGSAIGIMADDYTTSPEIVNNTIRRVTATSTSGTTTTSAGIISYSFSTGSIRNNVIDSVSHAGTTSVLSTGIMVSSYYNSGGVFTIVNNMISKVAANAANNGITCAVRGISTDNGATVRVYHNTVYLAGTGTNASLNSAAMFMDNNSGSFDLRSNIFYNNYTGTGKRSALYASISNTNYWARVDDNSNNNLLYAGTPGTDNNILTTNATVRMDMTTYRTGAGPTEETNSFSAVVPFINIATLPSDLHIDTLSAVLCAIADKGIAITSPFTVTTDIDNDTRLSPPDVGADEFSIPTPVAGSIAASSSAICVTPSVPTAITINGSGQATGAEINYQWQVNTGSGYVDLANAGVYSGVTTTILNIADVTGLNGNKYQLLVKRCSPANKTINTNEVTLTVSTASVVTTATLNASPALICAGNPVTLTQQNGTLGTGAVWQWYTDAGFTTTVGGQLSSPDASLVVTPTVTTTYYLRAINGTAPCTANLAVTGSVTVAVGTGGQWVGPATGGDWNVAANWCGGVPTSLTSVLIPSWAVVDIKSADAVAANVTIQGPAGGINMTGTYNLGITSGGTINNAGSLNATASTGAVIFNGSGTVNGSITFKNVIITGGVNFGTSSGIGANGSLSIQGGGFVNINAPSYDCTATLVYNTGNNYGRGAEWTTATSGNGFPGNVRVTGNTTLNYPNGSVAARSICGNLTIDAGSSLYMDYGGTNPTGLLTVGGNVLLNGNMSLSNAAGGDLQVAGNWTRGTSGNFYPNSRAVIFNGSSTQTITRTGGGTENSFDYMVVNKPSGNLQLNGAPATAVVLNASSGNVLQLLNGTVDLNGQSLSMNNAGGNIFVSGGARSIIGAAGSNFNINGAKTVTSALSGTLVTGSNVTIQANAGVNFGPNLTTVNGTLQLNAGSFVDINAPYYGNASLLKYNNTGTYDRRVEWSGNNPSDPGYPNDVLVTNNTILQPGGPGSPGNFISTPFNALRNVTIDAGAAIYMDATNKAMTVPLKAGGNLTINGSLSASTVAGGDVYVGGNWLRTGTFTHHNRAVFFDGNNNATLTATGGQEFAYAYLNKTGATLQLLDNVSITTELGPQSGTLDLAAKDITILSTAATTARVAPVSANIVYGTGRFSIERYLPSYRAWRFVASPVRKGLGYSPTVRQSWQENNTAGAGYGTYITGPEGTTNGFDTISPAYSMKWYDAVTNNYINIRRTDSLIANDQGYMVFVRGDRTVSPTGNTTPTNLRIKGEIRTGDQVFNITAAPVHSIGNPFASPVNMEAVFADAGNQGIGKTYVAWDPSLNGSYYVGGYQYVSPLNTIPWTASADGTALYAEGEIHKNIQSGQAIFVQNATGAPTTLTIRENMKATGSELVSRDNTPADRQFMSAKLYTNAGVIADGNFVAFDDELSNAINEDDAIKFLNSGENFGMLRSGKKLAIEARKRLQEADTIFYNMSNLKEQTYKLHLIPQNLASSGMEGYFIDRFLNTRTAVNLAANSIVDLVITSNAASKAADRFYLVFKPMAGPVPVRFISVAAQRQQDRSIAVNWKVTNEVNIVRYEVERSANGSTAFSSILTKDAEGISSYSKNDLSPLAADNFYRIKATGIGGEVTYSPIVKVAPLKATPVIAVTPNPVQDKQVNIRFVQQPAGNYAVQLNNALGQVIYNGVVTITGLSEVKMLPLAPLTAAGTYQLHIKNSKGEVIYSESILVE